MSPVDEGLIHAWLDGQLPADEAARVDALVASDPAWRDAAAEARGLLAASARILGALDDAPTVRPIASAPSAVRPPTPWYAAAWLKAAAGVVLIAGVATVTWNRTPEEVRVPTTDVAAVVPDTTTTVRDVVPDTATNVPASVRVAEAPPARETAAQEARAISAPPPAAVAASAAVPPTAQKTTADATGVTAEYAGRAAGSAAAELAVRSGGRGGASTNRTGGVDSIRRDTATMQRVVISTPPVPLVERGFVGLGPRTQIPSACWYPLDARGVADSAAVLQLAALPMALDSAVVTRWTTTDGVTVVFSGRLTGDTLSGRIRESAGDIRQLTRDLKLVRGICRMDE